MKYKKYVITALVLFIVVLNAFTVFRFVSYNKDKQADSARSVHNVFGNPERITVCIDGKKIDLPKSRYTKVLSLVEYGCKYVEAFEHTDASFDAGKLSVEFAYDTLHSFKYDKLEYDTMRITINLYNAYGDMLLQTDNGNVSLGYINVTPELIKAVK